MSPCKNLPRSARRVRDERVREHREHESREILFSLCYKAPSLMELPRATKQSPCTQGCHCEERSDEAIPNSLGDCFPHASLRHAPLHHASLVASVASMACETRATLVMTDFESVCNKANKMRKLRPLQKPTTEYTEHAERVKFMSKRIFLRFCAYKENFYNTILDKIIFSFCDLRGLCGEKITFLQ